MSKLIIALDIVNIDAARRLIAKTHQYCEIYSVGLPFFIAHGRPGMEKLYNEFGIRFFLDLKFYGTPHIIEYAANILPTYADFIVFFTVHRRAVAAAKAGNSLAKLIAVTRLTSEGFADDVNMRAAHAIESGADGVTCSGKQAIDIRRIIGPDKIIISPGLRISKDNNDDHIEATTLAEAHELPEVDYWVVGRPIINARDPGFIAKIITNEIAQEY